MGISTEILKSSFSKNNTTEYKLSILIGMDSLTYSVCSLLDKELFVLKKIDFDPSSTSVPLTVVSYLKSTFAQESIINLSFAKVQVRYISKYHTIIPDRLYSDEDKAQYLIPLKNNELEQEQYFADSLPSINSHLIYALPLAVVELLDETFSKKYQLRHSFSSLIEAFSRQAGKEKELFLNVRDYSLQIFFFDKKELIFSNQFNFQTDKDFLYYVLLVYDQFRLNPMEIPLKIAGTLSEDSKIYQQLYRYIKNISFVTLPLAFQTDLDLKEHPQHLFFDILHTSF